MPPERRPFFDTNILLYAISRASVEGVKRHRAQTLLDHEHGALSVRVVQEFVAQSTRANRPQPLYVQEAWQFIQTWRRHDIQDNTMALVGNAYAIRLRENNSFWDCMIIAAAQAQGCDILYTEDMQHGRIIDGLRIVNPFRD